jgi:DNA invertase Pin-like site-specific DNA recombinase
MILDGYIRVSQTRGRSGDTFISPDVQRDAIARWADSRGVAIDAWHEDLDQTGGKLTRPGLDAMLDRIRTGQTGGLAVAHLDRLSRAGVGDALALIKGIHDVGGQIAVVDLGVDPTTPVGKFAMTLMLALAEMQLEQYRAMWDTSQERAIGRGIHFRAPFGYSKPGNGAAIVPDPVTAPLVVRAFEMRAAGESWPKIAKFLNAHHPPNRAAMWIHSTVIHVVRNRAYLGEASHGKHVQPDAHPALVTAELWEAANAVQGRAPARGSSDGTLLGGLVRCAGCRRAMGAGVTQGGGRTAQLHSYRCRRRHGAGTCEAACSIKRELVEQYVERAFLERYAGVGVQGVTDTAELDAAQLAVSEAEAELAAFRDNERVRDALDALGEGSFEDGIAARAERVLAARERLSVARTSAVGFEVPDAAVYATLTIPERRRLLRAGVGAVFVRRSTERGGRYATPDPSKRVLILWPGEEPNDLPGRHTADTPALVPFDWQPPRAGVPLGHDLSKGQGNGVGCPLAVSQRVLRACRCGAARMA